MLLIQLAEEDYEDEEEEEEEQEEEEEEEEEQDSNYKDEAIPSIEQAIYTELLAARA